MSVWVKKREERKKQSNHIHTHTYTHPLTCPECGSSEIVKAGYNRYGEQIYQCNNKAHGRHRFTVRHSISKTNNAYVLDAHVCAILEEAKNMAETSTRQVDAGKGEVLEFAWKLKKKGLKENTIKLRVRNLEWLHSKGANLADPSSVETVLCSENLTASMKYSAVAAYKSYCKVNHILWEDPPKVDYQPREPFIPTASEVNALIHGGGRVTSTLLQVAATTGARVGEICRLRWRDVDFEKHTISINDPEKGSNTRTIVVPEKTISMLNSLKKRYGEYIFHPNSENARNNLVYLRQKLADKNKNPRFLQVHMHSFRHYFARKKLIETNNQPYVQYLLGHKNSASTDRYTKFKNFPLEGKYKSAIAVSVDDARRLVEDGWQFVCNVDSHPLFRKGV
jgi:integrase/predicted RNA-binding Zn-ribbon protein involved in translation (DUF1610 family)